MALKSYGQEELLFTFRSYLSCYIVVLAFLKISYEGLFKLTNDVLMNIPHFSFGRLNEPFKSQEQVKDYLCTFKVKKEFPFA